MDIRVLKYFLAVAHEENITRASEILHISQPSLSKQIMELEKEFGKKLFIRGKRKTTLTDDGILLRKRAEELILLFDKTEQELNSNFISGNISIGGGYSDIITQTAFNLYSKHPDIHFHFYSGDAIDVQEKLDDGTLDFGILIDHIDITKYDYIPLPNKDMWGFLMTKNFPLSSKKYIRPEDIENIPIVIHRRTEVQRKLSIWSGVDIEKLNIIATYNVFFNNPLHLVKKGLACAFISSQSVDWNKDDNICFCPIYPKSEIQPYIVWKRYQVFSKASSKFLEMINEEISLDMK